MDGAALELPYGHTSLKARCRLDLKLLEPRWPSRLDDVGFDRQFPRSSLRRFLSGRRRITIIVPDESRPCRAERLLSRMAPLLEGKEVTLLTANGIHPPMPEETLSLLYGRENVARWQVVQHDAGSSELVSLGTSPFGHDIRVNRLVKEADGIITISVANLHYFAGFGGGRKMIFPGVGARASITENHKMVVSRGTPGAGVLRGNPVHREFLWVQSRVRHKVYHLVAGLTADLDLSKLWGLEGGRCFNRCCDWVRRHHVVRLSEPFDFAVASCGGFPKDINLVQAHKSLEFAYRSVKPGGVILFLAACPKGAGSRQFLPWFRFGPDLDAWKQALLDDYQVNGQTALAWQRKCMSHEVWMVSDLPEEVMRRLPVRPFRGLAPAIEALEKRFGRTRGLLIPHAAFVMPVLAP
jgi:lactate racemase